MEITWGLAVSKDSNAISTLLAGQLVITFPVVTGKKFWNLAFLPRLGSCFQRNGIDWLAYPWVTSLLSGHWGVESPLAQSSPWGNKSAAHREGYGVAGQGRRWVLHGSWWKLEGRRSERCYVEHPEESWLQAPGNTQAWERNCGRQENKCVYLFCFVFPEGKRGLSLHIGHIPFEMSPTDPNGNSKEAHGYKNMRIRGKG